MDSGFCTCVAFFVFWSLSARKKNNNITCLKKKQLTVVIFFLLGDYRWFCYKMHGAYRFSERGLPVYPNGGICPVLSKLQGHERYA